MQKGLIEMRKSSSKRETFFAAHPVSLSPASTWAHPRRD